MLQQLGPLAGARVADLLAEAVDENAALGRKASAAVMLGAASGHLACEAQAPACMPVP